MAADAVMGLREVFEAASKNLTLSYKILVAYPHPLYIEQNRVSKIVAIPQFC